MTKHFDLSMPDALYDEVVTVAKKRGISPTELFQKFVKFGLVAMTIEADSNSMLLIREGEEEREIVLL